MKSNMLHISDPGFRRRIGKRYSELYIAGVACLLIISTGPAFGQHSSGSGRVPDHLFPSTIQFSPAPSGKVNSGPDLYTVKKQQQSINSIISKGFSNFWIYHFSGDSTRKLLNYAQSRGMAIDYMTSGFEMFDRYHPPAISVYSPQYKAAITKRIDSGLAPVKDIKRIYSVFPFQDEPFHAGPESFDYSKYAKAEFSKRYGYPMPLSLESVRNDPKKWLDLLNFQSNTFRDGWIQVYHAVKDFDPRPKVVMTHDSHNSFGAGVRSNSKVAIDDVFHWGGDFADVFVYDIYPYMTFDYRYGELGKLPKPRISQMHYTISQMRNLTTAYGKELGFWVGTYCDLWFSRFKGPERKNQYWSEQEMSYTAIAQGADFLISPSSYNTTNLPVDSAHWENYSKAMGIIQKAGSGLLKAPKVKAKACFLFPRTQYLQLQEEYFNVGLSFELFLRAFGELDIIHEEQITDDKLNGYQVLVLADVKLLPAEVAGHIESFVRNGGIVIADCVPQMDAYKQPLNIMTKLFGVSSAGTGRIARQGQWVPFAALPPKMSFPPPPGQKAEEETGSDKVNGKAFGHTCSFHVTSPRTAEITTAKTLLKMESGQAALIRRQAGKGRAYLFDFCIQDTYFSTWKNNDTTGRRQLRSLISEVFRDAGVQPHICSSNPDIEASLRAGTKEGYVFIINHESDNPETLVRLEDPEFLIGKITDIATGKNVDFKRSSSTVEFLAEAPFGRTRLLRIMP